MGTKKLEVVCVCERERERERERANKWDKDHLDFGHTIPPKKKKKRFSGHNKISQYFHNKWVVQTKLKHDKRAKFD